MNRLALALAALTFSSGAVTQSFAHHERRPRPMPYTPITLPIQNPLLTLQAAISISGQSADELLARVDALGDGLQRAR